ncbi:hypothetical protein [Convivina intestini]|uniref:Uncharacterized protein n=1 Tax=Convivina intestini TaxID=1505726 RepID=A0A2U1D7P7_9LACO|nr:hypothetical protein [Convivina intestini]PVY83701.1 hypothetical protein C7384_10611 [Convivina intestini]CAH1855173.1 hypothetical protein R077811_01009 [Convivina intestini]SDB92195.1 hypothetical protein SAMN05216341_10512 [Leuconostocaceae bacterium R-53105]
MQTKVVSAVTDNGLEKKLNSAINDIEQQGHEVINLKGISSGYCVIIMYK